MRKLAAILLSAIVGISILLYFLHRSADPPIGSGAQSASETEGFGEGGQAAIEQSAVHSPALGRFNGSSRGSIAAELSPQQALEKARHLAMCAFLGGDDESYPDGLSDEQMRQLDDSRRTADCASQKYSAYELVEYAASSGNVQAQVDFPGLAASIFNREDAALDEALVREYKAHSLRYLTLAARAGHPEALSRLSESYQSGRFSRRDPVAAYAYAYAYNLVSGSELSRLRLTQLGEELSSGDLLRAQQLGQSLLAN